ncbi:AbiJ-related protein [Pedobacter panaciterrae]
MYRWRFLQFLSEMIPPLVRGDINEVDNLLQIFNHNLKHDGFEIVEKTRISNKPIFSGRATVTKLSTTKTP